MSNTFTAEENKIASANFAELAASNDPLRVKKAEDMESDIIRERLREESIVKKNFADWWDITTNGMLERQRDSEENVRYFDFEFDTPASMTVSLSAEPNNYEFYGRVGVMKFTPHITPRMFKNINRMRTYPYDIRKKVADNVVRDVALLYDYLFFEATNICMGGAVDVIPEYSDAAQWTQIEGSFGRETIPYIQQQMNKVQGDRGFGLKSILMNINTAIEPAKMYRDEAGGDIAEDMLKNGVSQNVWSGLTAFVSIKRYMIADGTIYGFLDPQYFFRGSHLQELTMHIKSELDVISFVAMDNSGMLIANPRGVVRTDIIPA